MARELEQGRGDIPLWKQRGDKTDTSTWRGITLLSVGSKLLAAIPRGDATDAGLERAAVAGGKDGL